MSTIKRKLRKRSESDVVSSDNKLVETPPSLGRITLNSNHLPELKDMEINSDHELTIKVRLDSKRIPTTWELEDKDDAIKMEDKVAEFTIFSVKYSNKNSKLRKSTIMTKQKS